ncbi:MAG: phage tail tape measure protein [Ruminococcus flavefaciens]|nr:phage tail tape measure protein [Ruminococcus flavefaciens]
MELFKLFGTIAINNAEANNAMDETAEKADGVGSKIISGLKSFAKWGIAITSAAVAAGTAVTKLASNFESSFAKTRTLLSGSEEEIERYKDAIVAASNETGVSTDAMCESVYNAISAGVDQADAIGFVTDALKLAKGGFTDTSTAVDVLTTALNAYGYESSEATRISDVLITTQNLGKTTVDELAASMGKVIPIASAYGINVENLGASYATLTAGGIATAEATTYMKSMFTELAKEGTTVSDILINETGKSFSELMADGYSVGDVMQVLSDSVDGNATAFAGLWSSTEAGTGALSIVNAGASEFNKTLGEMQNAAGATEQAFGTMENTLSERLTKIKTNFLNMAMSLGEKLLPIIEKVCDLVIQNMPVITGIVEKLSPVLTEVFDSLLPPLMQLVSDLFPVIIDLIQSLIPPITQIMTAILPVITDLLNMLLPPIIQIVQTILPLLISLIEPILPLLEPIVALLQPLIDLLMLILEPLIQLLNLILPPLIEVISFLIEGVLAVLQPILEWFANFLGNTLGGVISGITDLIGWCAEGFKSAWQGIQVIWSVAVDFFQGIWDGICSVFSVVADWFKGIFDKANTAIHTVIDPWIEIFSKIWDGIKQAFSTVANFFGDIFSKAWNSIKQAFQPAVDFFKNIWSGIKNAFGSVADWFKNIFSKAWQAVKNVFSTGGKIFDGIKDGIVNAFKTVVNGIIRGINKVIKIPFDGINGALNKIKGISILGVEPFGWISTINTPQIPELAEGGVLKKGQTGYLEGDGDEAVVPLEKNTGWIQNVAKQIHAFTIETKDQSREIAPQVHDNQEQQVSMMQMMDDKFDRLISMIAEYFPEFAENMQHDIVLDDGTMVAKLTPKIDRQLGIIQKRKERG